MKILLPVIVAGSLIGTFFAGGYFVHGYGVQQGIAAGEHICVKAVNAAISHATYPTVYLNAVTHEPMAIVHDGYCTPYPRHLPEYYNRPHYVSPDWQPCTQLGGGLKVKPSPALAAVKKEIKQ